MAGEVKLSKAQADRLANLAAYVPTEQWPLPAFGKASATDRSLARRGLVERVDHTTSLGGDNGPAALITATWNLCRITDAGRNALASTRSDGGGN